METFIRKQRGSKAHRVIGVEATEAVVVARIDRLGNRRLRRRQCGARVRQVHDLRPERRWADLTLRGASLVLVYQPRRLRCRRCGVHVDAIPWAEPWARVTRALAGAIVGLARRLSWQETARIYGLNWKSVASLVRRAVDYGLAGLLYQLLLIVDERIRQGGNAGADSKTDDLRACARDLS